MAKKLELPIALDVGHVTPMTRITEPKRHLHGHSSPMTATYRAWVALCARKYDYRGQTCSVAPEWVSFEAFLRDVGECPEGHWLERIDGTKGLVSGNVHYVPARRPQPKGKTTAAPSRPETRDQKHRRELAELLATNLSAVDDGNPVD